MELDTALKGVERLLSPSRPEKFWLPPEATWDGSQDFSFSKWVVETVPSRPESG